MGPKAPHSTTLSADEETLIVAFRRHTLLPLDECLDALQTTVPHLTRSSRHRLFQRNEVSCLPHAEGTRPRQKFKAYPMGYLHVDFAEVWTGEGKLYLFVAIDRVSKFAYASLEQTSTYLNVTGAGLHESMKRFEQPGIRCTSVVQKRAIEQPPLSNEQTENDAQPLVN